MVLFTEFAIGVLGGLTTNAIISATKNEAGKIDTAYDAALNRTVDWYENQYGDEYGTRTNRFFDYLIADEALEKILLNENPMSAEQIAAQLKKEHQCQFLPDVIAAFQSHLIDELENDPVTAPLLMAIRNSSRFKQISDNTGRTAANTGTMADDMKQILIELKIITGMYPQATPIDLNALRKSYYSYLTERYSRLEFKGFSEKMLTIPIRNLYTRLSFSRDLPEDRSAYLKARETGDVTRLIKAEKTVTFNDIMASRFSVITGDPGAGKSTFLKYIAIAFAENKEKQRLAVEKPMLPILFPVSAFADALRKPVPPGFSIEDFLTGYFKEKSLPDMRPLFQDATLSGSALYLIDGLDEVSNETERQQMVQRIRDFIINHRQKGNRYLVTCRTASYTKATRFEAVDHTEFSHFRVLPFDRDQIEQFLLNWYRYYHKIASERVETYNTEAKRSLKKMMAVIDKDRNIGSIATNPLMLTILALVEHEGGTLPENRAELYQKCLNLLAGTWENIRSLHISENRKFRLGDRKITEDFIVHHLGPVAKRMHENAEPEIGSDDLKQHLAKSFNTRNKDMLLSREQAGEFIRILKQQSGIIQEATPDIYCFSHPTFKEYLTARFLSDICEDPIRELGEKLFTPEWREVVHLIAATFKKRDATNFITAIIKKDTPAFENIALAGECVADIGRDRIFDDCYDALVDRLEKTAFGNTRATDRAPIAEVLGRIGDRRQGLRDFVRIPGGQYRFKERKSAVVSSFEISKYPVTNGWFSKFITAGGYEHSEFWTPEGQKWLRHTFIRQPEFWDDRKWNTPNAPVVGVCWYEAAAFCRWLTKENGDGDYFLPDDNQWEAAAAGKKSRKYPWGDTWKESACNTEESRIEKTSPVGIFKEGDTPEGVSDLAGNVWEWTCSDYHSDNRLDDFPFDLIFLEIFEKIFGLTEEKDKERLLDQNRSLIKDKNRQFPSLRGGSWYFDRNIARCANRHGDFPYAPEFDIGFRCVRTVK